MIAKHNFLPDKNVFILPNLYVLHIAFIVTKKWDAVEKRVFFGFFHMKWTFNRKLLSLLKSIV